MGMVMKLPATPSALRLGKFKLIALVVGLVLVISGGYLLSTNALDTGIKSSDKAVLGVDNTPSALELTGQSTEKTFTSDQFTADHSFNAIAPVWKEENATERNRTLEIRVKGEDGWTQWMEIDPVTSVRENDPMGDRTYMETPIFVEGDSFQYRTTLKRPSSAQASPKITDLEITYIDSRPSTLQKVTETLSSITKKVFAANGGPNIVSRAEWDSPDPNGNKFHGTDSYWQPTYDDTEQAFLHHTVTENKPSDPEAVVRGIWDYHAKTLGWGDIGYNYIVDHEGTVYEGRFGGDHTQGGHVRHYNQGSLGVAVLGCFQSTSSTCDELNDGNTTPPTDKTLNSLSTLLSWKTTSFEIDPKATHTFCDSNGNNCLNIPTIAAHRDANNTTCNGDLFYNEMDTIRQDTADKNSNNQWGYAARQTGFSVVDLSGDKSSEVTLSFKNTGTESWSNSDNRMLLRTDSPRGGSSDFEGSDWLDSKTLAKLNETSVATGETGTFTFKLRRPGDAFGRYYEGIRLVSENNVDFNNHYGMHIKVFCSFGYADNPRPNGTLIRNPGNGKIFLIENGKKRHIASLQAANSNRWNLNRTVDATSRELGNLDNGSKLKIKEGTVVKPKDGTKIFIIDETAEGYKKRHISGPKAYRTFDLDNAPKYKVRQRQLDTYTDGPAVYASSDIPDGLIVTSSNTHRLYLTENNTKRYITKPVVFYSHGYRSRDTRSVSQGKIDQLTSGDSLSTLRTGTVVTTDDSVKTFAIDTDGTTDDRRHISTSRSLTNAGFRWKDVRTIGSNMLNSYENGDSVACHK